MINVTCSVVLQTHTKTKAGLKGKAISAKLSARSDVSSGRGSLGSGNVQMGLAPPMSSVIVERHQPVTKVFKFFVGNLPFLQSVFFILDQTDE